MVLVPVSAKTQELRFSSVPATPRTASVVTIWLTNTVTPVLLTYWL